ncbi:MAG: four helix bundle protein [Deltaproteobacteria bacterium]|nr:four helix bundle protein [Deltaproteobacteria bacterium]
MEKKLIRTHRDLDVYKMAFEAAMQIFEKSRSFPIEERYSLTDQIRRSSRSVCANLAEAWRKRRYEASFVSKLSDAEAEAAETQVWLEFAIKCGYLLNETGQELLINYDNILGKIVSLINDPLPWLLPGAKQR